MLSKLALGSTAVAGTLLAISVKGKRSYVSLGVEFLSTDGTTLRMGLVCFVNGTYICGLRIKHRLLESAAHGNSDMEGEH